MKKLSIILSFLFTFGITFSQSDYTAYVFVAEDCPICNYLGGTLKKLSESYPTVHFVAVFPQSRSNYKTASEFKKQYGLSNFEIILDSKQDLTKKYNATVTPEIVLINSEDGEICYRGRINNAYAAPGRMRHGSVRQEFEAALKTILAGGKVAKPWPEPIGCYITRIK